MRANRTSPEPAEPDIPDIRHRARRQRWLLLLTFALLVLATIGTWRMWVTRRVAVELAEIRRRGEPATLEEVQASLPPMPAPQDNAAAIYEDAFSRIDTGYDEYFAGLLPILGMPLNRFADDEPFPDPVLDTSVLYLELNADALRLLDEGDALPHMRHDLPMGVTMRLPWLSEYLRAANLRALQAQAAAELGDTATAARGILGAWRLSERMREYPPLLISRLVHIAMRAITLTTLRRVMNRVELYGDQLARIAEALASADPEDGMHRALLTERAWGVSLFEGPPSDLVAVLRNFPDGRAGRAAAAAYRVSGLAAVDEAIYLEHIGSVVDAAKGPIKDRIAAADAAEKALETELMRWPSPAYTVMTRTLGASMTRAIVLDTRTAAQVAVARAAVAVERYRLAEGKLPDRLDEVAPRFIDAPPSDPFTGGPIVYRKLEPGFVVYSLGEDKIDDGGAEVNKYGNQFEPGSDVPFRVGR